MRIRSALIKDLEPINDLTFEMHSHIGSLVGIRFSKEELKDEMYESREDLKNVYVAEVDREIVGYIAFSRKVHTNESFGKYYHVHHIAVKQEHQRRGIATRLLNVVLKKAEVEKVNIVTETFSMNKAALELLQKIGFKPIETVLVLDNTKRLRIPDNIL